MWWGMHDGMGWWMLYGGIFMVLFWGLLIWLMVWGVGRLGARGEHSQPDDPLRIAQRRYARGEITRQELEEIQTILDPDKR